MDLAGMKLQRQLAAAVDSLLTIRGGNPFAPHDPLELRANQETMRFILSTDIKVSEYVLRVDNTLPDGRVDVVDKRIGTSRTFIVRNP